MGSRLDRISGRKNGKIATIKCVGKLMAVLMPLGMIIALIFKWVKGGEAAQIVFRIIGFNILIFSSALTLSAVLLLLLVRFWIGSEIRVLECVIRNIAEIIGFMIAVGMVFGALFPVMSLANSHPHEAFYFSPSLLIDLPVYASIIGYIVGSSLIPAILYREVKSLKGSKQKVYWLYILYVVAFSVMSYWVNPRTISYNLNGERSVDPDTCNLDYSEVDSLGLGGAIDYIVRCKDSFMIMGSGVQIALFLGIVILANIWYSQRA